MIKMEIEFAGPYIPQRLQCKLKLRVCPLSIQGNEVLNQWKSARRRVTMMYLLVDAATKGFRNSRATTEHKPP